MMNGLELHHEAPLKRRWDEKGRTLLASSMQPPRAPTSMKLLSLSAGSRDDDMASTVVPPVTVVLDGRSICHRICLDKHSGYESLAKALRLMFVDDESTGEGGDQGLNLANAVPGYVVAYEDLEDDLLLVGDLNWKDFVRVAKRIRIVPAKSSRRKHCEE
ncbi:hypothetical protein Cni_G00806 [Canna indica]|uniref:Auxin-responsive protein n=1 Tax=Canna indica TaxID=4628 RepID=A0AAQ3PX90_9LILI|nr:hypothetical protein Cni_G00806 [Canna indica]